MEMKIDMVRLQMIRESHPTYEVIVRSPNDIKQMVQELIGNEDKEHFIIFMLNTKNLITAIHTVSIGSINSAIVHPREVFKALLLNNSASVILAHNHPSGDPTPSPEDIGMTARLAEVGNLIGIEVLDHIIVGNYDRFISMKEKGLM